MIVVRNAFVLFASTVLLTGCVSKSRYDAAVAKSDEAVAQHRLTQAEVLQLPDDVLFDTGRTALKSDGRAALEAVAGVLLIDKGVAPEGLSAAGYGETDPIADNTTVEGRKRNRRTEISVQPNIDELVKVP